jgi:hypothetical protein
VTTPEGDAARAAASAAKAELSKVEADIASASSEDKIDFGPDFAF